MLVLHSGSTIQLSPAKGWIVVAPDGSVHNPAEAPQSAFLLLEEDPTVAAPKLPGFPFDAVIDAAQATGHPRFINSANRWIAALYPDRPRRPHRR
jgi:hypothetical protein